MARSLYSVITCPHGGIPCEIFIENGSEFGALAEAVARFSAMAEIAGLWGDQIATPFHRKARAVLKVRSVFWRLGT